jgi:Ca-activated chloride channel homolog
MKFNEEQFESNISRLVKSTRDSDKPSDAFTSSLVDQAVELIEQDHTELTRDRKIIPMKATWKLFLTCAAAITVIAGLTLLLINPFKAPSGSPEAPLAQSPTNQVDTNTNKVLVPKPQQQDTNAPAPQGDNNELPQIARDDPNEPELQQPDKQTPERIIKDNPKLVANLAPLPIKLPKPMFVGTPQNIQGVPKLEKPRGKARPPFYAPAGVKNVALGKTVTGTDMEPIMGNLEMLTDDDKEAADGSYVELGPFVQNVTIDLEQEYEIYAILFWHFHKQARVYFDVIVQIANDPDFIDAQIVFNNDHDNSAGLGIGQDLHYVETNEGKLIDTKGVRGRYVRFYSSGNNANDLNHYVETQVFGKLARADEAAHNLRNRPASQLAPLNVKLPKPLFVGTPQNLSGFQLEQRRAATRPAPSPTRLKQRVTDNSVKAVNSMKAHNTDWDAPSPLQSLRTYMDDKRRQVDGMLFKHYGDNAFIDTANDHLSTFAVDVDTGSYAITRRYLTEGNLPPHEAVRIEEFVNSFDYDYPPPHHGVFAIYADAAKWRFGLGRQDSVLLRIGLQAREVAWNNRQAATLTFVIDVSGSMGLENRLDLVKQSLRLLVDSLTRADQIGIVVYGSQARIVLHPTSVTRKGVILSAIEALRPEGATNLESGLQLAYIMADEAFRPGQINRVILCSDGVANVGRTSPTEMLQLIRHKTDKGITLSTIGFGMGNYNDVVMEQLANKGDGQYAYIDSLAEARAFFEENLVGALQVVAKDVKTQVDFNPAIVQSYRLIGYENRDIADERFRHNQEDAGEMGSGHAATALYELKLWPRQAGKVAVVKVRYQMPGTRSFVELNSEIFTRQFHQSPETLSPDFVLAATVAEFASVLKRSPWSQGVTFESLLKRAHSLQERYSGNAELSELIELITQARKLSWPINTTGPTPLPIYQVSES